VLTTRKRYTTVSCTVGRPQGRWGTRKEMTVANVVVAWRTQFGKLRFWAHTA
jgi:hypothetical protein